MQPERQSEDLATRDCHTHDVILCLCLCSGALMSLGNAFSPALMNNNVLATIQGNYIIIEDISEMILMS